MYKIYVRQMIEVGIKDSDKGRTVDVDVLAVIHGARLLPDEI
jgi:hypothetical protein